MNFTILVCLASVATFITAVLGGSHVGHIVTNASLIDSTFTTLISAVLASQVLNSGVVISFLLRR